MQTLARLLVSAVALLLVTATSAANTDQSKDTVSAANRHAHMEKCFREHANLMEKPALRNLNDCWHAHAYLMERRK